jgi:hypothetical protein
MFAWGALEAGHPDAAAAAVICFEWLQRPENVLAGYDYRGPKSPTQIRIEHHKTGEMVLHPLEETVGGVRTLFYEEAEAVLAKVPRLGLGIVMRDRQNPKGPQKWDNMSMARLVRGLDTTAGRVGSTAHRLALAAEEAAESSETDAKSLTDKTARFQKCALKLLWNHSALQTAA